MPGGPGGGGMGGMGGGDYDFYTRERALREPHEVAIRRRALDERRRLELDIRHRLAAGPRRGDACLRVQGTTRAQTGQGNGNVGDFKNVGLGHVQIQETMIRFKVFGHPVKGVQNRIEAGDEIAVAADDKIKSIKQSYQDQELNNLRETAGGGGGAVLFVELGLGSKQTGFVILEFFL